MPKIRISLFLLDSEENKRSGRFLLVFTENDLFSDGSGLSKFSLLWEVNDLEGSESCSEVH